MTNSWLVRAGIARRNELSARIDTTRFRSIVRGVGMLLSLASLVFVGRFLLRQSAQLPELTVSTAAAVCASSLLYGLVAMGVSAGWRALLAGSGVPVSQRLAFFIVWRTQIAKYLPSNVLQYGGRLYLAKLCGIGPAVTSATLIYEVALTAIACLLLSARLLGQSHWLDLGWSAGLMAALAVLGIASLIQLRKLPRSDGQAAAARLMRSLCLACGCYVAVIGLLATGLFLILWTLVPGQFGWAAFPAVLAGTALAWIAGLAAVGSPAGLGVREAVLLVSLQSYNQAAGAVAVAVVLHRISTTLGDCAAFGLTFIRPPAGFARR